MMARSLRTLIPAVAFLLISVSGLSAQHATLGDNQVYLPKGIIHRPLRGTDSRPGYFMRADSSFVIHYDIGKMAGTHMHVGRKPETTWFIEHELDGRPAFTGAWTKDGKRMITTTVMLPGNDPFAGAANFFAEIRTDQDVAEFVLIVGTFARATVRK